MKNHIHTFNSFSSKLDENRKHTSKRQELEERILDLKDEMREVFAEMEAEAGMAGENWTDDDANRYGDELNRIEDEIAKIRMRINKMDESYLDFQQAASVAQDTEGAQRYEYGSNPNQMEMEFPKDRRFEEEPEEDFEDPEVFRKHMESPTRKLDSIMTMAEIMKGLVSKRGKNNKQHPYVLANLEDAYMSLRTAYLRSQDGF
jgi:hypothetical protein